MSDVEQTGSNFGMAVRPDTPFLSCAGSATVVADGSHWGFLVGATAPTMAASDPRACWGAAAFAASSPAGTTRAPPRST